MFTPCEKINLHDVRVDNDGEGGVGKHFLNSNLSSWRSMCKYYSGDVKCMPNKEVLAKVTKAEALDWEVDFSKYPMIDDGIEKNIVMKRDNYREYLKICSMELSNDEVKECEQIDYHYYTSELQMGNNNVWTNAWTDATKEAKCTEIGYLYGLNCKRTGDGSSTAYKCTQAECNNLDMYLENSPFESDSTNVCRALGCAVDNSLNSKGCINFDSADDFKFKELDNEGMSLGAINAHCKSLGKVLDLSYYNTEKHNFEGNDDVNVCTNVNSGIDLRSITDDEHCKEIGAINGFQAGIVGGDCKKIVNPIDCASVTFEISRFAVDQVSTSSLKIPVNAFYDNEDFSYGTQLCESIGCFSGAFSSDNYSYTCAGPCDEAKSKGACDLAVGTGCTDGPYESKCYWNQDTCLDQCPPTTKSTIATMATPSTKSTIATMATPSTLASTDSTDSLTDGSSTTTTTGIKSIVSVAMTLVVMAFSLCM